ncbi:glycosyltransferase family 4 protein [Aureimonas fodinaquatilis]|uniref:glycosyltransferase family 4 protein n=1 Tax=Aureimonas fodinaquatilis TaxID=2565783 RepID=UPI001FE7418D|nr:glycosyltransferase family 4 protein [Aureimonas fodinaquatilis]
MSEDRGKPRIAVIVKGYPRLSETFIAQEILGLEQAGFTLEIWSLRHPTDSAKHPLNHQIQAAVNYLPEYLYQAPLRVAKGLFAAMRRPGFGRFCALAWRDLRRDPTPNRMRRIGQALVLARELNPQIAQLYVHFLHTPASVARYAAILRGNRFGFSAHAKDIWTTQDWEKREKIADAAWGVTCTRQGYDELRRLTPPDAPDRIRLVYHGLDLSRFPEPPVRATSTDGNQPKSPVRIVTVGRMVAKKGFSDLLQALAMLPEHLAWQMVHIGSGELKQSLQQEAEALGLSDRVEWRGAMAQSGVIAALRDADIFALACREGDGGDRDGLPNVLMEAATQELALLSTAYAGVPELINDGENGLLVSPADPAAFALALERLIRNPALRRSLGQNAHARVRNDFEFQSGITTISALLQMQGVRP